MGWNEKNNIFIIRIKFKKKQKEKIYVRISLTTDMNWIQIVIHIKETIYTVVIWFINWYMIWQIN